MDSLYGGKPGTPFILKKSFPSIEEMQKMFYENTGERWNDDYTDVFYGEFCIIDTPDKRNPENGMVFRRGFNGPEYIGQIVGPGGMGVSNLQIRTYNEDDNPTIYDASTYYPTSKYTEKIPNDDTTTEDDSASENGDIADNQTEGFKEYELPKPDEDNKLKSNYKYITYTLTDYSDIKFDDNNNNNNKPFYKEYECFFSIYSVIENITIDEDGTLTTIYSDKIDEISEDKLSWIDNINFDEDNGEFKILMNNDSFHNKDKEKWELEDNKSLYKKYLTFVKDIKILSDGTIELYYTHRPESHPSIANWKPADSNNESGEGKIEYNKIAEWISKIKEGVEEEKGKLIITFNTGKIEKIPFVYPTKIELGKDNKFYFTYSDGSTKTTENSFAMNIKQIDTEKVKVLGDDGNIDSGNIAKYNDDEDGGDKSIVYIYSAKDGNEEVTSFYIVYNGKEWINGGNLGGGSVNTSDDEIKETDNSLMNNWLFPKKPENNEQGD